MTDKKPRVSDHAVLRFLERAQGFDVDAIRAQMLTPTVVSAINAGACAVQVGGIRMMVKDKTITTVLE